MFPRRCGLLSHRVQQSRRDVCQTGLGASCREMTSQPSYERQGLPTACIYAPATAHIMRHSAHLVQSGTDPATTATGGSRVVAAPITHGMAVPWTYASGAITPSAVQIYERPAHESIREIYNKFGFKYTADDERSLITYLHSMKDYREISGHGPRQSPLRLPLRKLRPAR